MPGPFDGAPSDARALDRRAPEGTPRGVVLMLHGGTPHSLEPVGARSGSLRRMQVLRDALPRDVLAAGHALWLLRYARRGWNGGTTRSPVPDARWALDQVRAAYGDVPVVLARALDGRPHREPGRRRPQRPRRGRAGPVVRAPATRSPRWPARTSWSVTACATGSPPPGAARRSPSAPRPSPPAPSSTRSAAPGHYLLYRPRRWNRFALRHSLDVLARCGATARTRSSRPVV